MILNGAPNWRHRVLGGQPGQARERDAEVLAEVVVAEEAPADHARAPADGQVLVAGIERAPAPVASVVEERVGAERDEDGERERQRSSSRERRGRASRQAARIRAASELPGGGNSRQATRSASSAKSGAAKRMVGRLMNAQREHRAGEDRALGVEREEHVERLARRADHHRREPDGALDGGEEVDGAEREEQREGDVLALASAASVRCGGASRGRGAEPRARCPASQMTNWPSRKFSGRPGELHEAGASARPGREES